MSSFVTTDAAAYETFMGRWSERLSGPFLAACGIGAAGRVLDVGCGTGVLTAALADAGAQEVVGVDALAPYLDHACRHRARPNVRYELGDARRLAFADASFDGALSSLVLDVLPEAGRGRIGPRLRAMDETLRAEIRSHIRAAYLGGMVDGPRSFVAVARAVRGVSPG